MSPHPNGTAPEPVGPREQLLQEEMASLRMAALRAAAIQRSNARRAGQTVAMEVETRAAMNMALSSQAALVQMLVERGLFTREEYLEMAVASMREHVRMAGEQLGVDLLAGVPQ